MCHLPSYHHVDIFCIDAVWMIMFVVMWFSTIVFLFNYMSKMSAADRNYITRITIPPNKHLFKSVDQSL